jgi:cell division topological specificity factor
MKSILNDIFNELKNKYKQFLSTTMENADTTKETATNRLRFVLMHDRTNLSPETMERMRDELVEVISKYVVIDTEALDLNLATEGDAIALLASIPILRAKTKEEQEEAILEIEKKRLAKAQEVEEVELLDEEAEETETTEETTEESPENETSEVTEAETTETTETEVVSTEETVETESKKKK